LLSSASGGSQIPSAADYFTVEKLVGVNKGGHPAEAGAAEGVPFCDISSDWNFWLLLLILFQGMGSSLAFINNIGQFATAVGGGVGMSSKNVAVVAFSTANCFGRLFWGYMSDRFPFLTRAGWLTGVMVWTSLSMVLVAFADEKMVLPCALLVGFSFGGYWSLVPSIIADLWGIRWFALSYAGANLAPAAGSFVFGARSLDNDLVLVDAVGSSLQSHTCCWLEA
jgi:MFS family permease